MQETIYTPKSQLRQPLLLFKNMIKDLSGSRELAWRLFVRNISAMYRQTIFGYLWAFLPPIFTTLTFVFLNSQKVISVGDTGIPYPVYVMIGTILWQLFVDAMNSPIKLVSQSKEMLSKINFPREALIMAGIGETLFNFLVRLSLLIFIMIWYKISVPLTVLLAPIGIFAIISLGLMFGILFTPLSVLYQDVERGLSIFTSIWFFITPVVYPAPTRWPISLIAEVNPISPLLVTTRELISQGFVSNSKPFLIVSIITFFMIFIGWLIYRLAMPHLIARIGS